MMQKTLKHVKFGVFLHKSAAKSMKAIFGNVGVACIVICMY